MKTLQLSCALLLIIAISACQKNDNAKTNNSNVSNAEAADMVANSLAVNSNGAVNVSLNVSAGAGTYAVILPCGVTKSDSISIKSAAGAATTYSYKAKYSYTVYCNSSNKRDSVMSSYSYSGSFNGPKLSSSNSGSSNLNVGGLLRADSVIILNGQYTQAGSFKSKVDTTNAGSNNVNLTISNIYIQKHLRLIKSGSASITVTGNVPKKGNFSFTGTIVFNSDNTAKLTLNGTVYIINLITGIVTKQ
jgi:hypothetical protein